MSLCCTSGQIAAAFDFVGRFTCMFAVPRLRPDNPYLLLDEFGEGAAQDSSMTTELGVMSNEEAEHNQGRAFGGGPSSQRAAGGHGGGDSIDPKFSLGEEEDVTSPSSARSAGVSQPRSRTASA